MNYSKAMWEIERDFVKRMKNAFIHADNGQQCASMFDELDKSNPDIHEYINRIQQATAMTATSVCSILIVPSPDGTHQRTFSEAMSRVTVRSIASMQLNLIRQSKRLCTEDSTDKENRLTLGLTLKISRYGQPCLFTFSLVQQLFVVCLLHQELLKKTL